jgi:hypothetical protein
VTATIGIAGQAAYARLVGVTASPQPAPYPLGVQLSGNNPGDFLVAAVSWRQNPIPWTTSSTGTPTADNYFVAASNVNIRAGQQFTSATYTGVIFSVTNVVSYSGTLTVTFNPGATGVIPSGDTLTQLGTTVTVADDQHNWWYPLQHNPATATSSAAGITRTTFWGAPASRQSTYVTVSPTGFYMGLAAIVYNVSGMSPYSVVQINSSAYLNTSTAIALTAGVSGTAAVFSAVGTDVEADTISISGGGWSTVDSQGAVNGTDTTSDIVVSGAYQVAGTSVTADWASTGSLDWSANIVAITVAGTVPTQPNPNWPYTLTEVALGSGPGVPPDLLTWTPLAESSGSSRSRVLSAALTQGRQYMLDQLQTGQGTLVLDDQDQSLIPPGSGQFGGVDSGNPFRVRMAWPGGAWQVEFSGNGSTADPQIDTGKAFSVGAGGAYTTSAWLACSVPYAAGLRLTIVWYTSGGSQISTVASAPVTGTVATLTTVSGVAPATAAKAGILIGAAGTPASSVVFYASAANN